jgi:hypothetical protein
VLTSHYCSDRGVVAYRSLTSYPPPCPYLPPIFKSCSPLCSSTSTSSEYRTGHFQLSVQPLQAISAVSHLLRYPCFTNTPLHPINYLTALLLCTLTALNVFGPSSTSSPVGVPLSTLIRLLMLHMICWPEMHVKLQILNKDHIGRLVSWDGCNGVCE